MKRSVLAAVVLISGCGYFNALYHAERRFDDAERAAARGEHTRAGDAYGEAIERAASSYRRYPDGRWADDALYVIVRSRFGRGEYAAARVAAMRLAAMTGDEQVRLGARAYEGAALVRLDSAAAALPPLDAVVAVTRADRDLGAFARLWRARARFTLADTAGGWADLADAVAASDVLRTDAALETTARALAGPDTARLRTGFAALLRDPSGSVRRDSVIALARVAARVLGPADAAALLGPPVRWSPAATDSLTLVRARFLAEAGDTEAALAALEDVYNRVAGATGTAARRQAAELMLRTSGDVDLAVVRAVLLPAVLDPAARDLVRDVQIVSALAQRGRSTQPLALFAAGEHARDRLRAGALARSLFLAYADRAPTSEWAPKALLAALALVRDSSERRVLLERLDAVPGNVYVRTFRGGAVSPELAAAEERLARVVSALRSATLEEVGQRDLAIDRAVSVVDSLQAVEAADSMRMLCGAFVDSLALVGIRADSTFTACVRSDTARVNAVLVIDTLELVDTTAVTEDTTGVRIRNPARPDTNLVRLR